jgi:hypothetical protein
MWWILYGLGIITLVIFIIIYVYPSLLYPIVKVTNADLFDLSSQAQVLDKTAANDFEQEPSATVQGIFYINPLQRTPSALSCGSPGPNCNTGRFDTCVCENASCQNCNRNGYISIFQVGDSCVLEVLPAPDAGRQGKATVQLAVRTQNNTTSTVSYSIEFLVLPPLDLQRWTMITIVREGRRFNVYYNDVLVLSQKTEHMISATTSGKGIMCGNTGVNGKAVLFTLYKGDNGEQSALNISFKYKEMTDTRGVPRVNLIKSLPVNIPQLTIPSFCPSGNCVEKPCIRPSQPWLDWSSSYA